MIGTEWYVTHDTQCKKGEMWKDERISNFYLNQMRHQYWNSWFVLSNLKLWTMRRYKFIVSICVAVHLHWLNQFEGISKLRNRNWLLFCNAFSALSTHPDNLCLAVSSHPHRSELENECSAFAFSSFVLALCVTSKLNLSKACTCIAQSRTRANLNDVSVIHIAVCRIDDIEFIVSLSISRTMTFIAYETKTLKFKSQQRCTHTHTHKPHRD